MRYGSCQVHKASVENCLPFRPILKPLTTNEFTVKDSFHFAENFSDQQHEFFIGSLDLDSLVTNIPLEETIEICTNERFKESETVEGLSKSLKSFCLWLLRIQVSFLLGHIINKSMVRPWVLP